MYSFDEDVEPKIYRRTSGKKEDVRDILNSPQDMVTDLSVYVDKDDLDLEEIGSFHPFGRRYIERVFEKRYSDWYVVRCSKGEKHGTFGSGKYELLMYGPFSPCAGGNIRIGEKNVIQYGNPNMSKVWKMVIVDKGEKWSIEGVTAGTMHVFVTDLVDTYPDIKRGERITITPEMLEAEVADYKDDITEIMTKTGRKVERIEAGMDRIRSGEVTEDMERVLKRLSTSAVDRAVVFKDYVESEHDLKGYDAILWNAIIERYPQTTFLNTDGKISEVYGYDADIITLECGISPLRCRRDRELGRPFEDDRPYLLAMREVDTYYSCAIVWL